MGYKGEDLHRNLEIRAMYDALVHSYQKEGKPYKAARELSYDAVCLRFTLSRKRARDIINANARNSPSASLGAFVVQNKELLQIIDRQNSAARAEIERNLRLSRILKAVISEYERRI